MNGGNLEMKITQVKITKVHTGKVVHWGTGYGPNWLFVKVYTDEGIQGLGEAFHSLDEPIEGALCKYARWLVGRDPTRVSHNWHAIYRGLRYPAGTAELSALSAVEHALWDISGKACGLPVYKMLGGPTRDRIRLYASFGALSHFEVSESEPAQAAAKAAEAGFTALKFGPQPEGYETLRSQEIIDQAAQRVRAVRMAVGQDMDICLDYHGRSFSPSEAIRMAAAVEPYNIFFLEEPALSEYPDSLVEVKAKTSIPIAAGERAVTRDSMRQLIEKRAVHIIQPEPTANGGILETVRMAAVADLHHIAVAPHHACSPVALLACAHIDASIPNFLIQECNVDLGTPLARDIFIDPPRIVNGYLELPQRPGLGIELNEEAAAAYAGWPNDRPVIVARDGSIGLE